MQLNADLLSYKSASTLRTANQDSQWNMKQIKKTSTIRDLIDKQGKPGFMQATKSSVTKKHGYKDPSDREKPFSPNREGSQKTSKPANYDKIAGKVSQIPEQRHESRSRSPGTMKS